MMQFIILKLSYMMLFMLVPFAVNITLLVWLCAHRHKMAVWTSSYNHLIKFYIGSDWSNTPAAGPFKDGYH